MYLCISTCLGRFNARFRPTIRSLVKSAGFYWIIIVLVFVNTVSLSFEHYGEGVILKKFHWISNAFFLSSFVLEMALKMYGLGVSNYFMSNFNRFDCVVVLASCIEFLVQVFGEMKPIGISVLRCFRLLRIFKLFPSYVALIARRDCEKWASVFFRYWISLKNLVASLLNSIRSILSLLFLLFLFIVIFALLGMQLFGGR